MVFEVKKQIEDKDHKRYVLSVVSGQDSLVIKNLQERIKNYGLQEDVIDFLSPSTMEVRYKNMQKVTKEVKLYPGYVFVKSRMNDKIWYIVRNTPGVRLIVGAETHPVPLTDGEFQQIQEHVASKKERAELVSPFRAGDIVTINDGDFADMQGTIKEIDEEKNFAIVSIEILGRITPAMIPFDKLLLS